MKKIKQLASSACMMAVCLTSSAVMANGFYVAPTVGWQYLDDERPVKTSADNFGYEQDVTYGIGVGYEINSNLAVELRYDETVVESDSDNPGPAHEAKFHHAHVDALVGLGNGNVQPYIVLGVGHQEVDTVGAAYDQEDTVVNGGVGVKMKLGKHFDARMDVRAQNSVDSEYTDGSANIGVVVKLGGSADSGMKATKPTVSLDADKDGVLNAVDQCPNTAMGAKVNAQGCYKEVLENKTFTMMARFSTDSSSLTASSVAEVAELAAFMKQYPKANVVLEGHTDSRGDPSYNQSLSKSRANAVAKSLVTNYGVDSSRVKTIGYGESKPVATNNTKEGRAKNRRVVGNVKATIKK